jgi:hypothetical protein
MHTLAYPTRLPIFEHEEQTEAVVDAYDLLSQPYVNGINKWEIQPYRYVGPAHEGRLRSLEPVGQSYTIRPGHLTRLICASNRNHYHA